ncbi:uncharacterized protein LOC127834290 [Dreissena polymorpha]|uniref:uncharacterized protein LOC127834290 n=1 Tax=Dreissena polymorpha TaxID=45954 RepID=UPI0022655D1D|nr:uncharacterized protein LOC127834290 [Dreissena polymorpha]
MLLQTRSKLESQDQIQRSGTSRRARQKRHVPASPNFFFRGRSGVNPSTRAGVFLWETSSESFSDVNSFERAETNAGFVENVTVLAPGVYYVFATIVVHGRRPRNGELEQSAVYPPMGAMLHRRKSGGEEEVLDVSFCTQDDRGAEFGYGLGDYPLDSVQLRGLYYLDFRDTIWVTKPTNMENNPKGETYHSEQTDMHFGAFMVDKAV